MPLPALALVLCAAFLHAFWNLVIARVPGHPGSDRRRAGHRCPGRAAAGDHPLGTVRAEAWPYIAASSALELLYFWLLTTAYRRAEMSLVYPIAVREVSVVIGTGLAVAVLRERVSPGRAAGSVVVVAGVALVVGG